MFGVLFARPFVVWLAGERFAGSGPLLAILTFAAAISLVNGYLAQIAVYTGAERGLWRAIAVVTVTNLAANAVAVTLWSATGAASVMILSEAVALAMYWRVYRGTLPSPLGRRYPMSVVAATATLVVIWLVLHLGLGLQAGAGAGIIPRVLLLSPRTSGRCTALPPAPAVSTLIGRLRSLELSQSLPGSASEGGRGVVDRSGRVP